MPWRAKFTVHRILPNAFRLPPPHPFPFPFHFHLLPLLPHSLTPSLPHSLTPSLPHSLPPLPLPLLRDFTLADHDTVLALWRSCEGIGLNESDTREAIAAYLQRNPGLSLIAMDSSDAIVGAVLGGHDGRRGYLHHLAVAPAFRKRGLGRALVDEALVRLRRQGVQKCSIFLYASNTAGRAFWLREGWAAREDLVVVQKQL